MDRRPHMTRALDIIDSALDTLTHEQARLLILAAARKVLAEMGHEPTARQLDACMAEYADGNREPVGPWASTSGLDLGEIVNLF